MVKLSYAVVVLKNYSSRTKLLTLTLTLRSSGRCTWGNSDDGSVSSELTHCKQPIGSDDQLAATHIWRRKCPCECPGGMIGSQAGLHRPSDSYFWPTRSHSAQPKSVNYTL